MEDNHFKILIVDDEPEARNLLKSLLSKIKNVTVAGEADNVEHVLYLLVEHYPHLILMDINMPGKTGMELVKLLKARNVDVPVVFVSAFEEYAVQAIRNQVYDFLLKPVCIEDLKRVIEKYKRLKRKDLPGKLMEILKSIKQGIKIRINTPEGYLLLDPDEIVYVKAGEDLCEIYLCDLKKETLKVPFHEVAGQLNQNQFYHMGRNTIVNLDYIRQIDKNRQLFTLRCKENEWQVEVPERHLRKLLKERYSNV